MECSAADSVVGRAADGARVATQVLRRAYPLVRVHPLARAFAGTRDVLNKII